MKAVMTVYLGENGSTPVERLVEPLNGYTAGRVRCFECDGSGIWVYDPDGRPRVCTDCKGTGHILVSI